MNQVRCPNCGFLARKFGKEKLVHSVGRVISARCHL